MGCVILRSTRGQSEIRYHINAIFSHVLYDKLAGTVCAAQEVSEKEFNLIADKHPKPFSESLRMVHEL